MFFKLIQKSIQILTIAVLISILALSNISALENEQEPESDADNDGLPDSWELNWFGNTTNYGSEDDPDSDGLSNLEEYQAGTDPTRADTDADGMDDSWEVQYALDPTNQTDAPADYDGDGLSNYVEFTKDSNPWDRNSPPKEPAGDGEEESELDTSPIYLLILFAIPPIVIILTVVFVYTKMRREQLLEHKIRAQIFEHINKNPGVHYRGILNDLNLQIGVLNHHLNMLEQERYIKSVQDGMYRRFYSFNAQVNSGLILTDVQEKILQHIRARPGISQADLARNLGYTRKVVYYHVKILSNAGFIHVEPAGRESRCFYIEGLDFGQPTTGTGISAQVQGS